MTPRFAAHAPARWPSLTPLFPPPTCRRDPLRPACNSAVFARCRLAQRCAMTMTTAPSTQAVFTNWVCSRYSHTIHPVFPAHNCAAGSNLCYGCRMLCAAPHCLAEPREQTSPPLARHRCARAKWAVLRPRSWTAQETCSRQRASCVRLRTQLFFFTRLWASSSSAGSGTTIDIGSTIGAKRPARGILAHEGIDIVPAPV
jgi:hypothetical protein